MQSGSETKVRYIHSVQDVDYSKKKSGGGGGITETKPITKSAYIVCLEELSCDLFLFVFFLLL